MNGDLILALVIIGGIAFLIGFTWFLVIADRRSEVPYRGDD